MTLPQRIIKQTLVATVYGIISVTIVFLIVIIFFPRKPEPPVVELPQPKSLQVVKYNKITLGNGFADYWAEISNPNDDFGAKSLDYAFVLKDSEGQVQKKTGKTYILPGDKKRYVLLLNYSDAYLLEGFELSSTPMWTELSKFNLPELVIRNVNVGVSDKAGKAFTVFGILTNSSKLNLKNIQVISILTDSSGNIIGVNETLVRDILTSESREFEMTWDTVIPNATVSNTIIYAQSNVVDDRELLIQMQQGPIFDR
ncbi:MAG: hypothetical protein RLZZ223_466 [Candidatus Parcubacteria bacterium]|jgi:hypothetical protein